MSISDVLSIVLLLSVYVHSTYSKLDTIPSDHSLHNDSANKFTYFWQSIGEVASDTDAKLKLIANRIVAIRGELNQNSSLCYQAVENAFRSGLRTQWSAKLINSNSFGFDIPSSLISEQYSSLGDFDDCLSVADVELQISDKTAIFDGKYCLASLVTPQVPYGQPLNKNVTDYFDQLAGDWLTIRNRFPLVQGICAPSVCSNGELTTLLQKYFDKYLRGMTVQIGHCQQKSASLMPLFTFGYTVAIIILLSFIGTSILGTTVYSIMCANEQTTHPQIAAIAQCFHMQANFKALFSVHSFDKLQHDHNLTFIYGLKAFMILLIVLVHSFCFMSNLLFSKVSLFTKYPSFYNQVKHTADFAYNIIERGFLIIDLFFIISGFLVSHLVIRKFRKLPKFGSYVLNRYFRFVPSVISILCLTIVFQQIGTGPLFHKELTDPYVKPCYDYWWTHVLFINNFWTIDQMCGPNLWFVSADFQLHILLYFVLYLYFRKQIYAYISSIVLMTISFCTFALLVATDIVGIPRGDYPMRFNFPAPLDAIRLFYTSPLLHIFSYLMGAFVAFRLVKVKRKPAPSKYEDALLVFLMAVILFSVLCPLPSALLSEHNENTSFLHFLIFTLIYVVIVLAAAIAFYILIMANKSSFFKQLFSARFILPLGRLSYGIYLLNPLLIWYNSVQYRQTVSLTTMYTLQFFSMVYMQSIVLSIFLFVFFESPSNNLSRLFMKTVAAKKVKHSRSRLNSVIDETNSNPLKAAPDTLQSTTDMNTVDYKL